MPFLLPGDVSGEGVTHYTDCLRRRFRSTATTTQSRKPSRFLRAFSTLRSRFMALIHSR